MKAAIYARVSTDRQETLNQVRELREYAARHSWEIVQEYVDEAVSGKSDTKPQLEAMLLATHQKKFSVLIFWSLDRLTRKGALDALEILERLGAMGVDFVSFREPYISSMGPFRDVVVALVATIARFETERMSERIRAGLARARAEGKRLGRPPADYHGKQAAIVKDRRRGASWGQLASKYRITKSAARRLCQKGQPKVQGRSR